jgi:pimeloyl-ACP methyl ester carboxylesterase
MDPLLLIHGTGGDASTWDAVAPLLGARYRVLAYSRSGYGRSHAAHAADALRILDERAPGEAAYVVGSSSGAIVALHLALAHPDRVRALVLAEPPLWARKAFEPRMLAGMVQYGWNLARGRKRQAVAAFIRTTTRYRDGGSGFDALAPALREQRLDHADDVIAELRIGTGEDLTPDKLRTIACPTTLLLGARSAPMFARIGGKLAAAMPALRTVTVAGAGHLMMMEQPRAFADAIIAADTARPSAPAA